MKSSPSLQDKARDGCGNGCLPGTDEPVFSCNEGCGVFSPLSGLTPDMRCMEQASVSTEAAGPHPTALFEVGSMVEVKGYGFGVVQWLGTLRGTESAGVELVMTHTLEMLICPLSLSCFSPSTPLPLFPGRVQGRVW